MCMCVFVRASMDVRGIGGVAEPPDMGARTKVRAVQEQCPLSSHLSSPFSVFKYQKSRRFKNKW